MSSQLRLLSALIIIKRLLIDWLIDWLIDAVCVKYFNLLEIDGVSSLQGCKPVTGESRDLSDWWHWALKNLGSFKKLLFFNIFLCF